MRAGYLARGPGAEPGRELIDDYYDHRRRQVLTPLYEQFKRWEAGELTHSDIDRAIHETHRETQHLYSLFGEKRSFLVGLIQWDEGWFDTPECRAGATAGAAFVKWGRYDVEPRCQWGG